DRNTAGRPPAERDGPPSTGRALFAIAGRAALGGWLRTGRASRVRVAPCTASSPPRFDADPVRAPFLTGKHSGCAGSGTRRGRESCQEWHTGVGVGRGAACAWYPLGFAQPQSFRAVNHCRGVVAPRDRLIFPGQSAKRTRISIR